MKQAIIMAAGKGTRMMSEKPKVLHKVCGRTMIEHLVSTIREVDVDRICTIVGYGRDEVMEVMDGKCEFAVQDPQLGTGHAVMMAKQFEGLKGKTLVVNGDCPCLSKQTFEEMFRQIDEAAPMCILTVVLGDPKSYGRVIKNPDGSVKKIVEFKDSNDEEKKVREINTGIYCFDNELLFRYLQEIRNTNAQQEYYITDLVEIFNSHGHKVRAYVTENVEEVQGVNNKLELAAANSYLRGLINRKLMTAGVEMIDPDNIYISEGVVFGRECTVYPNVVIEGECKIGNNTVIGPGTYIRNAEIGNDCNIGSNVNVSFKDNGFAIIRDGASLESSVSVTAPVKIGRNAFVAAGTVVSEDVTGE